VDKGFYVSRAPGRIRRRWWCLAICLCGALGTVYGQSSDIPDLTSLTIEDLARTNLFTASRHLEDPRKAPAKVTVIDRDEIVRYGWRTMGELLRSVPGIYTANDRNYTYLGVRGFLQSGDYNARVLLLIDGHRINENVYDSALIGTEFPLDLNLIDHVEIVCGPGSSLFGTNAELAVVNVFTRHPEGRFAVEAETETGSYLSRSSEVTGSFRESGVSGIFSGSLYRSNGPARLYFPAYDTPETNNGIAENLDGDRYDHAFAAIRRGQLRVEGAFGKRTKIVPTGSYGTNFNDPGSRSVDTRSYIDASWTRTVREGTDLDLRGYYDAYRYWASFPYGGTDAASRTVQVNDATADWVGVEAVLGQRLGRNRLVAGAAGEYNLRIVQRNYYEGQPLFLNDVRRPWLSAVFGEAELNPHPKVSINLGGRIDMYSTFGAAASPRLAVMFFPTARTSVKYLLGGAFRAPDAYDQYYVDYMDIEAPSGNLTPERSQAQSLLVEHRLTEHVSLSGELFQNDLDKVIEEQLDPVSGLTHFMNGAGDRGRGLDVEVSAGSFSGWSGRASYTAEQTEERHTTAPVINSPHTLAKLNGTAPLVGPGRLGVELLYTAPQVSYLGTRVASSFLSNATVSASTRSGWVISGGCYNVLDARWSTPTGPEVSAPATVQDGRTWRIRLDYRRAKRASPRDQ
jgi:outer membrane receptor for ferrienterochelin and colicins